LAKDIAKLEADRGQLAERLLALQQQVGAAAVHQSRAAMSWGCSWRSLGRAMMWFVCGCVCTGQDAAAQQPQVYGL
jgi:hypothetical protein